MKTGLLRVLIVDDSALFRVLLRDAFREIPGVTLVGKATNGIEALARISELDPDVVTLDVEMPDLNGIEVLREMKRRGDRTRAVMVSRHTADGAQVTTDALLEGAFDFVLKPSTGDVETNRCRLRDSLAQILGALREATGGPPAVESIPRVEVGRPTTLTREACELVLIGASTGGPQALREILPALHRDFPCPVLVVQHMPPDYTASLARRLDELSQLNVVEASDGAVVLPGHIYIAPGGRHTGLTMRNGGVAIRLSDDPPENGCRPSVDYLFRSAFETVPQRRILGVILTGMGHDGTEGCALLKDCGALILAQHADGCVVYGMPKSVVQRGLADMVVQLPLIAGTLNREAGHS